MIKIFAKKGVVLAEAIVTISILIMCAIIAGSIFTNASTTTSLSKDFLIANGLAIEGAESVRNIVYTNRMILPTDKTCWLTLDPATINLDNKTCVSVAAKEVNYIPFEKATGDQTKGKWKLDNGGATELDLSKGAVANTAYLLYVSKDNGRYTTSSANDAVASKFYRSVRFLNVDDNYATLEVEVAWFEGSKPWNTTTVVYLINK
ncbi:hypothetical protein M0P48_00125 [Candidatus Gracilibacteria bacterium]|jgi:hypothetical protein|nr:hypothetical protein [Candidatus Gracilibacteria bacterium]